MQPSASMDDDLPTADYEALDLSFDDIPPIESSPSSLSNNNNNNADPTEFTKPGKHQANDEDDDDDGDAFLDEDAYILGTLLVRIVAARSLPSVRGGNTFQKLIPGPTGTTNAYASIRYGLTTQRTTIVRDTADPLWPRQEFLYMDVTHPVLEDLTAARRQPQQEASSSTTTSSDQDNNDISDQAPSKKKKAPTMAKLPAKKPSSKASAATPAAMSRSSSSCTTKTSNSDNYYSPLKRQQPKPLDPPVLTVALFHAALASNPQKYNPSKVQKTRGDSDDVFLGMTSMDVTTLLTGKERCLDAWWPLQGGPDNHNNPSFVRVIVEYEPSDTAPHPGDKVKFIRYCNAADVYPFSPYGTYEVINVDGDDVTIGWTTPEGWCTSAIVRRHALVCEERQVGMNERDRLIPSWGTLGERLMQSPMLSTVQSSVARVPDEGLFSVAQDALTQGQGLLSRWLQGGLGTAVADVRHATNWDGGASPTAEESLELHAPPLLYDESEQAAVLSVEEEDDEAESANDRSILPNMPLCPISQEPMHDPVVAADGHTYDRVSIARWLATSDKSPLTGAILAHKELAPNYMLLSSLREAASAAAGPPPPVAAAAVVIADDASNDVPSLVDEDEGDLRDEQLE